MSWLEFFVTFETASELEGVSRLLRTHIMQGQVSCFASIVMKLNKFAVVMQ